MHIMPCEVSRCSPLVGHACLVEWPSPGCTDSSLCPSQSTTKLLSLHQAVLCHSNHGALDYD
jgi:hypothetical protein